MMPAHADRGTVIGIDWGERFIGIAIGERETRTAHPLTHIKAVARAERFAAIERIVNEWKPVLAVIGLPVHDDGRAHALAPRTVRFARALEGRMRLPFVLVNEYLSSAEASAALARSGHGGRAAKDDVHAAAATVILQNYLDDPTAVIDPRMFDPTVDARRLDPTLETPP